MEIDHVVLAAPTKADAERVLDQAGLGVARGRAIPGLGLSNLIVPLKPGQLLEIHYPNGEDPAPGAPPLLEFDREAFATHPAEPVIPVAWLVALDEPRLRELAAANDTPVVEAPAEGPDHPGYLLAGFGSNFVRRWLPCLIHWPEGHPTLSAPHRRQPTGVTRIDVAGPADEIQRWCGGTPSGLRTAPGAEGPLRVEIGFVEGPPLTLGIPQ